MDFFWIFRAFWILGFFEIFMKFFGFLVFLRFLSKLLRLLLKVTKVTTGHKKLPKMGHKSIVSPFLPKGQKKPSAKGQSPPQELEIGPRSGPYLLVASKTIACRHVYYCTSPHDWGSVSAQWEECTW